MQRMMSGAQWNLLFHFLLLVSVSSSATFTFVNNCVYPVWPGVLSGAGHASLPLTGFALQPGQSTSLTSPPSWSGRFWGRTLCSTNRAGIFSCATGDCGSGTIACSGAGGALPVTLAEFTLNGYGGSDFYDVSLVDGYNLPILIVPSGSGGGSAAGNCSSTGCVVDLNGICPEELLVVSNVTGGGEEGVACKSACDEFGSPEYCCLGAFGGPASCRPTNYSQFFKNACPEAYSYAYDDSSSTFTCPTGVAYFVTFCPSTTSQKSDGGDPQSASGTPLTNGTMVFLSGQQVNAATAAALTSSPAFIVFLATLVAAVFFAPLLLHL